MKNFLIIILILITGIVFYNYIQGKNKERKIIEYIKSQYSDGTQNVAINIQDKDIKETCSGRNTTITDENNSYVAEAKRVIVSQTVMSENYIEKHFKFLCGNENDFFPRRSIYFKFNFEPYSTIVNVLLPGSPYKPSTGLEGMKEINSVITPEEARQKLNECMGGYVLPSYRNIFIQNRSLSIAVNNVEYTGWLNLETGECTKIYLPLTNRKH